MTSSTNQQGQPGRIGNAKGGLESSATKSIPDYVAQGYRITSRKYGLVSRIDRRDWREYMAEQHAPWDPEGAGMKWVRLLGDRGAADHYRRVYSKDTLELGSKALRLKIPNSGDML